MSSITPNRLRTPGNVLNTTSANAPSLTDPSLNSAYLNQMVTVDDVQYFVDATGKAQKIGGGATATGSTSGQAIAVGTQATLDALTDKPAGGYYIVTDGANQGDILVWADTDGDGVGDTWQVYEAPTNNLEWTVLTNLGGNPAGQYTYSVSTDTWTKTDDVEPVVPPVDDQTAVGGIKFPTKRGTFKQNNGPIFIMYDAVAGFGYSASTATNDGDDAGIAANQRVESVRKSTYTLYQQNSPYNQIINYRPYFTDVQQISDGAVALDHKGVLYLRGSAAFMTAFANAESGLSNTIAPAYTPDKFWVDRTVKVIKYYLSDSTYAMMALTGDGTIWVKGNGATNGIYGDGTTAADTKWHQVNVPQQAYKKIKIVANTHCFALADNGDLYVWGANTGNRFLAGSTGVISTPVKVPGLPAIVDVESDNNSTMAITSTGARWYIGTNTNGKFGDGGTVAKTVWTDGSAFGNGFTFAKVIVPAFATAVYGTGYAYITTDNKAVHTGRQNLQRGIASVAAASDITTPTIMGNGAYQGTVIDIIPNTNSTLIHTNQGELWTAINSVGNTSNEHGLGIQTIATNNVGLNVFRKVPVPAPVVSTQTNSDANANDFAAYTILTTEGRVYNWGGQYADISNSTITRGSPTEVPLNQFRQGEPKALEQIDLLKVVGNITAATPLTITDIVDGGSNQTVTATFTATGTAGKVSLVGSTVTAPDVTFVSWVTDTVYMNSTTQNQTVQFIVNATDLPGLVIPNSQPQTWTVNLMINGA